MKHDEAAKIVAVLFASYPHGKFDRDNARAYVDGIADLDAAACGAAAQRLIRTNKFLPSIAEIREAAAAQSVGPRKTGAHAYDELLEAVRRHGATPRVRMHDGRVQVQAPWPPLAPDVAVAMRQTWGTWADCCHAPDAQEMADRARFIAAYDGLSERERADLVSGRPLPAPAPALKQITQQQAAKGAAAPLPPAAKAPPAAAAPAAIKLAPPRQKPGPAPIAQRMLDGWRPTAEELDAELARIGGAP
jgi:hypothetical protein